MTGVLLGWSWCNRETGDQNLRTYKTTCLARYTSNYEPEEKFDKAGITASA